MSYKPCTQPSPRVCRWALRIILALFLGAAGGMALTHITYTTVYVCR